MSNQYMKNVYVGTTYLYDQERFHDPQIVCIANDFDDVFSYLRDIRHIQVVDHDNPNVVIDNDAGVCAIIEKASFARDEDAMEFMYSENREPFVMQPYGKIDHRMAGMRKSDAEDVMLPQVVIDIINGEMENFISNISVTAHSLKEIIYYINGAKISPKPGIQRDSRILAAASNLLETYMKDERENSTIRKGILRRHPILFCNEVEYRNMIRMKLAHRKMDDEYMSCVNSDD